MRIGVKNKKFLSYTHFKNFSFPGKFIFYQAYSKYY